MDRFSTLTGNERLAASPEVEARLAVQRLRFGSEIEGRPSWLAWRTAS
ncbi:hypothetical protein [Sorangium sp. So ce887]